ncbi:serine/threonine protein kinase [Nonomuraea sp. ATR24]|uniref:serine/threonine protein kinase n=1 Tax=Nonomuraea sp. ATR24 TaxID=1676744 RepID=UPI0035C02D2A
MSKLGKVGPYTLLERLGRGGMGEVYLASARRGERVALKVLHDLNQDDSSRVRLEREVRALRRVESPYVATVLDADLACARPYLVMEHIDGSTLLDLVRQEGPLDLPRLMQLAQGIAAALAIIHAAGVVHRDLKPGNIIMGADGPVLIDFGIAQVLDATRLTMTGTFLGTPGYTAPEIFADEQVDSPADVHAWAATVAFAATGRPTFGRGTAEAQMYAVLNGQADLKGVPVALLPLVRAALNREPGKRPTAALLADRLARLAKATGADPDVRAAGDEAKGAAARARTGEDGSSRGRTNDEAAAARTEGKVPAPRRTGVDGKGGRGRPGLEGKTPAPRNRAGDTPVPRSASGDGPRGRSGDAAAPRGGTGDTPVPRSRAQEGTGTRRGGEVPAPRGRAGDTPVPRNRAGDTPVPRNRAGDAAVPRGRAGEAAVPRGRGAEGPAAAVRSRGGDGKSAVVRSRADDGKAAPVRSRTGDGVKAARSRGRAQAGGGRLRSETAATTLPAGNTALLLLAVLAVPCVVASVMWPIACVGITAVFVVLIRTCWMSHWMVRKRASRRVRVTLRVLLFPFALTGAATTAAVWPGVPAAVAAGGALWITGGGEIDSTWWQQPAPVTAAGVVFGMLCGGITGREIERIGARLPELRREGLRALAVLGGFVALCAAAVRAIALLL